MKRLSYIFQLTFCSAHILVVRIILSLHYTVANYANIDIETLTATLLVLGTCFSIFYDDHYQIR